MPGPKKRPAVFPINFLPGFPVRVRQPGTVMAASHFPSPTAGKAAAASRPGRRAALSVPVLSFPVIAPAALAAALGLLLLAGVGFVQHSALHEAAHDVRHSVGFPCH